MQTTSRFWLTGLCAVGSLFFLGADWPAFRGPHGTGLVTDHDLPVTWDDTQAITWRRELPGPGSSVPIVLGDRIYLTCYSGYGVNADAPGEIDQLKRWLVCVDRGTGEIQWKTEVAAKMPEQPFARFMDLHGYASSTPITDGQRIYCFFGKSGVVAFDLKGNQLWLADVGDGIHRWGSATSPVLFENLVIINASVESDALVALDRENGKEVWRAEGISRCWSTPSLVTAEEGSESTQELVVNMAGKVLGLDPATGKPLWNCDGIDDYICPSVLADKGIVYLIGGRSNQALAIRAGGRGDVTETHLLWRQKVGSNVPSPTLYEGRLYWVDHKGIALCLDAENGEMVYRERLPKAGRVFASVVAAEDKLYAVTQESGTFVLSIGDDLEVLSQNQLASDDSICNASPAICDGQLFFRTNQFLYCIGKPR
jgi:outer membrane protein assembly factor BamB